MQLPGTDHNQGSFNKYPDIFEIGDFFAVFSALVEETDRWQTSKIKKKTTLLPCSLLPDGAQSFVFLLKNCDGAY